MDIAEIKADAVRRMLLITNGGTDRNRTLMAYTLGMIEGNVRSEFSELSANEKIERIRAILDAAEEVREQWRVTDMSSDQRPRLT